MILQKTKRHRFSSTALVFVSTAILLSGCATTAKDIQNSDTLPPQATCETKSIGEPQRTSGDLSPQATCVSSSSASETEESRVVTNQKFIVECAISDETPRTKRAIDCMDVFKLPKSPPSNSVLRVAPEGETQYRVIVVSSRSGEELWYKQYSGRVAIGFLDLGAEDVDVYIQNAEPKKLTVRFGVEGR